MSRLIKSLKTLLSEEKNSLISEAVSKKLLQTMTNKFKEQTDDSESVIQKYIKTFDRIKQSLNPRERDISKYEYDQLKKLIDERVSRQKRKKERDNILKSYMETEGLGKGSNIEDVKVDLRRYYEIKDFLPSNMQDILSIPYVKLSKFLNEKFEDIFTKNILKKFQKESPDVSDDQVMARIERYINAFDEVPKYSKTVSKMNFDEFESAADQLPQKNKRELSGEIDMSDVDVVYEDDDVLIFHPDQKQKCINIRKKYAPDRGWCTSWEGTGNYYYNYRLRQNLTLYYVINKNLPFSDVNFATVILVEPYGDRMRLADGSNSGRYSGGSIVSWDEITEKVPVIKGKKELFKAKPLSDEESDRMKKLENTKVQSDAVKELGGVQNAELWLELLRTKLTAMSEGVEIYKNLPDDLKKKYIGLGNDINREMLIASSPEVIKYYLNKKKENLITSSLKSLKSTDLELLKTSEMKNVLEKNKERYAKEIGLDKGVNVIIEFPSSDISKFIYLYGLDDVFDLLSSDLNSIQIINNEDELINITIPPTISKFKQLTGLNFRKCIDELPKEIGDLSKLQFLSVIDCPNFKTLPVEIAKKVNGEYNLKDLNLVNITNVSSSFYIPEPVKEMFNELDIEFWS